MKHYKKIILVLLGIISLIACSSTQRMSKEDRAIIKKIYINEEIKVPLKMTLLEKKGNSGKPLSMAVGALREGMISSEKAKLIEVLENNKLNIEEMIKQDIINAFSKRTYFSVVSNKNESNAFLNIEIKRYGYEQTSQYSTSVNPSIGMYSELIDNTGRKIWYTTQWVPKDKKVFLEEGDKLSTLSFESIIEKPQKIPKHLKEASQLVVQKTLETLDDEN